MPEGIEIEIYRRAALPLVGRRVVSVRAPDAWFLKNTTAEDIEFSLGVGPADEAVALDEPAARLTDVDRIGKLLLLRFDGGGHTLGLRFGMTGRLVVDGRTAIRELEYSSARMEASWDRFGLDFEQGGLVINDPRRLGGVLLDPDTARLGVDLFDATPAVIRDRIAASSAPLKAKLLDQTAVAGVGNLIADETLWRAGLDPARPGRSLSANETRRLSRHLRTVAAELLEQGGSHTGQLQIARRRGGRCPRDGAELDRRTIGGRTTYSCPRHQA